MKRILAISMVGLIGSMVAAGCSPEPKRAPTAVAPGLSSAPAATDPMETLRAGLTFPDSVSFRSDVDVFGQLSIVSRMDSPRRRAASMLKISGQTLFEVRLIDDSVYLRAAPESDLPGAGDDWLELDPERVPAGFKVGFETGQNDPGGTSRLIEAITSARPTAAGVEGTLDLTQVGTGTGVALSPEQAAGLGPAGRNAPFEVAFDTEGRITSFVVTIKAGDQVAAIKLRYGAFGEAVTVARPAAGDVVPAPEEIYGRLGA